MSKTSLDPVNILSIRLDKVSMFFFEAEISGVSTIQAGLESPFDILLTCEQQVFLIKSWARF